MQTRGRPRKHVPGATHKVCYMCEEPKPVSEFHGRSAAPDGLQARCKECASKRDQRRTSQPAANNGKSDKPPKSDNDVRARNEILYRKRKSRKKECAYTGCDTLIGYHQDRYCRRHAWEIEQERTAAKLRNESMKGYPTP